MHVAQLNFLPAPPGLAIRELLERWPSLADIAELVSATGIKVSVLQAAGHSERLTHNGVDYRFVDIGRASTARGRGRRFAHALRDVAADVLHAHGLSFAGEALAISRLMSPQRPIVIQDHADRPPRWRRPLWRRRFAVASGVAFTAPEQAEPFAKARLFGTHTRLFAIPESSSRFTPGEKIRARAETALHGDPCVLWVGHLSPGKDPLAVLDGVSLAARRLPDLQLWCAYGTAPLLSAVRRRIGSDPWLRGRVHLLGKVPHERIEMLMRASDLFVSGSRSEGSGYAAIEALACGLVPVLTDIPAFRALTGDGRIGHLWPCGDPARLADALVLAVADRPSPTQVRAHFDATLSFAAVGRRWADAYAQVLVGNRRPA